jgi:hypothetical protein
LTTTPRWCDTSLNRPSAFGEDAVTRFIIALIVWAALSGISAWGFPYNLPAALIGGGFIGAFFALRVRQSA